MNRARVINFDQCLVIPCFKVEVRTGLRSQADALARGSVTRLPRPQHARELSVRG